MQGNNQAYAHQRAPAEEAALAFKRFILDETTAFEQTPEADLFRVNVLAQMLDRFDDYAENGANTPSAVTYVKREFADLAQRMREEGFEETENGLHAPPRWPLLCEDDAARYLRESSDRVHKRAIGVGLCSACVLPLLLLTGLDTLIMGYAGDTSSLLGIGCMFGMNAMGVYAMVTAKRPEDDEKIRKKRFSLSARLRRKLTAMRDLAHEKARRRRGKGIALLVACVLPIFLGAAVDSLFRLNFRNDPFTLAGVGGMFAMIGAGVYELIVADGEKKAVDRLLKD